MPKIIDIEKSQYLNDNIEIYTQNKVGQYSKYLEKNPLFVTWLHINEAETRHDTGLGVVNSDVGGSSPIRFNQINNFPVYNIPELKPDVDYSENGYDINLELSDITILPNTIKPNTGDYFILSIPNSVELCFRVNAFSYNTIQSNDFYLASADLKYTGKDLINKFTNQTVQVYETIFENIGTDDKCFILSEDVSKIKALGKLFLELRTAYYNNFFDKETGTFICKNNTYFQEDDSYLYDKYVEKFIMDSQIYYTPNKEETVALVCADIETPLFDRNYMQTMFYAVLNRTLDYLAPHPYFYEFGITKPQSVFILNDVKCKGVNLLLTKSELVNGHSDALDNGETYEYFSHYLIQLLNGEVSLDDENTNDNNDTIDDNDSHSDSVGEDREEELPPSQDQSDTDDDHELDIDDSGDSIDDPTVDDETEETTDDKTDEVPEDPDSTESDVNDPIDTPPEETPIEEEPKKELTYLEKLIYEFMTNQIKDIDRKQIIKYSLQVDNYIYITLPLVIYIIMIKYEEYFSKEEL